MKKVRLILLWAAVCAVAALTALTPARNTDALREELVRSRYGGWAGVLRLWLPEAWTDDGLTAWLNGRIAAFEKGHRGVYIQMTEVSEEALRGFAGGSATPPDLLVFPPGLLANPQGLLALPYDAPLRPGLEACGVTEGGRFALPVAMGGYGLAYNRAALESLPAAWRDLPQAPTLKGCAYWLNWPADGEYLRWSQAMGDLLADAPPGEATPETPRAGEGLDIGLPAAGAALLPEAVPADFGRQASVYKPFVNGEIAAMPVTPREIHRLTQLSDTGRGPDWAVAPRASAYTDQLALLAVTDCPSSDRAERQALCLAFAAFLLSEDSQTKLTRARLFPVTELPPLYVGSEGMAQLEAGLANLTLRPEQAFGL